ncbi:hypothetical protein KC866_03545 [Patescibacteria group bacterium]|nr:hypothetical protein [Patescibacteria group bacterium]
MSKWSVRRKRRILIVIGVLLVIVFVLLFVQVENSKQPTCFDNVQNGQETGIDCGGTCSRVCQEEINNLVVWWERPFQVAPGVYNTVAYIENQNLSSGIQELFYEFRLYDRDNILVAEPVQGSTFIEPNKRSAVFASGINTGDNEAYTVFFHINDVQNWNRVSQDYSYNLFTIGEPTLTNQTVAPKLSALVRNESFINFENVPVVAILYNQKGNAIAASQTFIDILNQGTQEQVFYSWPEPFDDVVARIEIIPRIDPFIPRDRQV